MPVICPNGGNSTYTIGVRETNLIGHWLTSFLRLAYSKLIIPSAILRLKISCYHSSKIKIDFLFMGKYLKIYIVI